MYYSVVLAADKNSTIKCGVAVCNWDSAAGQQML